jgi:hypothetical protein
LALGWPQPARILDLFVEFRNRTNGLETPSGAGLIGALTYFGLNAMDVVEKAGMRDLVMRGGPWSAEERATLLDYCESDVRGLERLLPHMASAIDLPRGLVRGRYMSAAARIEWAGTPIDTERLALLRHHWDGLQDALIAAIDAHYGVFEGRTFKLHQFEAWLVSAGIPWPRLDSGRLDLSDDTFRQMARIYPVVSPLRELRSALSEMRLNDLAVGNDGRNRTLLSVFRAKSGRNQPSNTKSIFGPSVWLRGLIKPSPGYGVAYIDWEQQEFGIAAALSGDHLMVEAYCSGDPYLRFAQQAGAVPASATKQTHPIERELFKTTVLGVQYGMEWRTLAFRLNCAPALARDLLRAHRETYRTFWKWSNAAVDQAMLYGSLGTALGWTVRVAAGGNTRSLRNFPMQATGGELLRLACCLATERGVEIAAPVHDAVLIVSPLHRLEHDVALTRAVMAEASRVMLRGFELRTDAKIIRYPARYSDPRGATMWARVMKLIAEKEGVAQLAA